MRSFASINKSSIGYQLTKKNERKKAQNEATAKSDKAETFW
jgi:hypothetical protein